MGVLSALVSGTDRSEQIALVHGRSWRYRQLHDAVQPLAAAMRADGLAGERIALMLPNGVELVTAYLACFASGAIAAPLNARYAPPEVEQALTRARPTRSRRGSLCARRFR